MSTPVAMEAWGLSVVEFARVLAIGVFFVFATGLILKVFGDV